IFQLAELGITLLLFIVGLELSPARLNQLRKSIILDGGLQVLLTTTIFSIAGILFGLNMTAAFVIGVALSLSSTAFALSYMTENSQLTLSHGQTSLSILLFQDLLIVPLLALLPLLSISNNAQVPINYSAVLTKFAIFNGLVILCFLALRPSIAFIKKAQDPEISLASFLFLIIGMAIGMERIGLSMPMGSFIAGVFLANSEVKTNIKSLTLPFKGILMGLFFMTLGIDLNFNFIFANSLKLGLICLGIIVTKSIILIAIGRIRSGNFVSALKVSLLISQAGELGIVVIGSALHLNIISSDLNKLVATSILITMIIAPFLARLTNLSSGTKKVSETLNEVPPISSNVLPVDFRSSSNKDAA
ncbi:MAG: cation:proton antiporter, partial [Bacteriovoracaceae bacterium]|nr:cation:proton antiporter [Bacteriovoracaceae bacterium]